MKGFKALTIKKKELSLSKKYKYEKDITPEKDYPNCTCYFALAMCLYNECTT
jgi:hypothetical protein